MSEQNGVLPVRIYRGLTLFLGGVRWLFLPIGIAALVAMGVHLASDVMVDGVFVALNAIDRLSEILVGGCLDLLQATGIPDEGWAARNSYAFATRIDIDTREQWARIGGVIIELLVDVIMVRAALGYAEPTPRMWSAGPTEDGFRGLVQTTRIRATRLHRSVRDYVKNPTVEKFYIPFASLCAVIAGCYAIGIATENALFGWLSRTPDWLSTPGWVPQTASVVIMGAVAWRLGWRMILHGFAWAEARDEKMIFDGTSKRHRRLRGLIPALIVIPVMLTAVIIGTPLGGSWGQ